MEPEATLPHDDYFERSVVGGLLREPARLAEVSSIIATHDFYSGRHQLIFRAMLDLSAKRAPIDLQTVRDCLEGRKTLKDAGGMAYLASLHGNTAERGNLPWYAQAIRKKSAERDILTNFSHLSKALMNGHSAEDRLRAMSDYHELLGTNIGIVAGTETVVLPHPRDLYSDTFTPRRPDFDNTIIRRPGIALIWAAPGGLKTHSVMVLCHEMLCDTGTGQLFRHPGLWINRRWKRVLWIATEECGDELRFQAEQVLKGLGKERLDGEIHYVFAAEAGNRLSLDDLPELIERDGPWDAIVLDSLTGLRPKVVNGERVRWDVDNDAANEACLKLRGLAAKHGVCFLIVHHSGRDTTRYRGATDWWASADSMIGLTPDGGRVKLEVEKVRGGKKPAPFILEPEWGADGSFSLTYAGSSTVKLTDTAKLVLAWFQGRGQASQAQAVAAGHGTRSTIQRTISTLIEAGLLRDTGNVVNASPIYAVVPTGAHENSGGAEREN